jgi:hypothetical protein
MPLHANYHFKSTQKAIDALQIAAAEYRLLVASLPDSTSFPRRTKSATDETLVKVNAGDWTSGFFPGGLWYLYHFTADDFFLRNALRWTGHIKTQTKNTGTGHDLGFIFNCSFGNAYRIYGHPNYPAVMLEAGKTLSNRYSNVVGCTKSWNSGSWPSYSANTGSWKFPVIIDNMMNMELLLKMTQFSKDSLYHLQALRHASVTANSHIRPDSSTFHVVDFDPLTGNILARGTRQGFSDASCWSRGQAWGIYGFSMLFKFSKDTTHLNTSKRLLGFYLKNKPTDHIPFWDYQAPGLPNTYRDASAASITCAALIDLYVSTSDTSYLVYAEQIIDELTKPYYLNTNSTNAHLFLRHSTGGTNGYEADVAQTYSDYYFIEALIKYLQINPNFSFPNLPPRLHNTILPNAVQNQPYSAQLEAFDYENDKLSFSSTNLALGWQLTSDGLLTSKPASTGVFEFDVTISDGKTSTKAKVKLSVNTHLTSITEPLANKVNCFRSGNKLIIQNSNSEILKINVFTMTGISIGEFMMRDKEIHILHPNFEKKQLVIIKVNGKDRQYALRVPFY